MEFLVLIAYESSGGTRPPPTGGVRPVVDVDGYERSDPPVGVT
jgi:hypothetical protein